MELRGRGCAVGVARLAPQKIVSVDTNRINEPSAFRLVKDVGYLVPRGGPGCEAKELLGSGATPQVYAAFDGVLVNAC